MPDELIDNVEETVETSETPSVLEDSIQDSLVITVNIDNTLSVSGDAADAYATGQAILQRASLYDIKETLNVNGRTGEGSWNIPLNGNNIPVESDDDEESVAEAISRIDTYASSTRTLVGAMEAYLDAVDVSVAHAYVSLASLRSDVDLHKGFSVMLPYSATGSLPAVTSTAIRSEHMLTGVQFFDSEGELSGNILADFTWRTFSGSLEVEIDEVYEAGFMQLNFGYREGVSV